MSDVIYKKRVLFIGVPDMALLGLDTLWRERVNIVGVLGPLKTHNTYSMFKSFVEARNLNFIEYDSIRDVDLIERIQALNIDIAVVCSFNNKIPKEFISSIKDGIINVHPSLLPKYRGGNPYSRAIMNGDIQTGVTIHFMSEELDKGDIILQEVCDILPDETMGTLFDKTNILGIKLLLKALQYYEVNGMLPRRPQAEGEFPTAPNIKDSEMYINYDSSAINIDRLVRALNPYFSAITFFKGQAVRIHKVSFTELDNIDDYKTGEICKIDNDKVYIKTAKGCIIPEIMQFAGYFIGNCADFIRIVKPQLGDRFTNGYA